MKFKFFSTLILILFLNLVYGQDLQQQHLKQLERQIIESEKQVEDLKPGNEAKIIWNSNKPYTKTNIVFLYLHGFGACSREGEPVMTQLSQAFNANVYMSRIYEHGTNRKDAYKNLTEEKYIASAKEALAIAKQLGDTLIVVGTSTGGSLSLLLASEDTSIKEVILYSPFIQLYNTSGNIITTPLGHFLFWMKNLGWIQYQKREGEVAKYWSTIYHVNAYVSLINLIKHHMNNDCFAKVKCPVFLGYYYKNEEEQDHTVSVKAMHNMFIHLGCPDDKKQQEAFPLAGDHVIACDLRSKDWQSVYNETFKFIRSTIQK